MQTQNELQSLQNFADNFDLKVKLFFQQDKRKKTGYFLSKNKTCISPVLNYDNMNHFLLGIRNSKKYNL